MMLMLPNIFLAINFAVLSVVLVVEYRFRFLSPTFFFGLWFLALFVCVPALWVNGYIVHHPAYSGLVYLNLSDVSVHLALLIVGLSISLATLATLASGGNRVSLRDKKNLAPLTQKDRYAAYICWIIGVAFMLFAVAIHGGVVEYLRQLGELRSGRASNVDRASALIMRLGVFSYLAVLVLWVNKFYQRSGGGIALSLFSCATILLFGAALGGRFYLLTLFCAAAIAWFLAKRKVSLLIVFIGLAVALIVSAIGKSIPYANLELDSEILKSSVTYIFDRTLLELSFPFLNVVNLNSSEWPVRYGVDLFFWFFKYFRLFGWSDPGLDTSNYFNTWLVSGEWESTIPPALVAFSYFQAGALGLLLVPALLVYLLRLLERAMIATSSTLVFVICCAMYMGFAAHMVFYASIESFAEGVIPLVFAALTYRIIRSLFARLVV